MIHNQGNQNMGLPVQFIHGMTSCSEWTGVPLSVLLKEVGVKPEGTWLVYEGDDPGKFSHTLPIAKAMEDVLVAYGQNGEDIRVEQGYPIRMLVPGWEGPFSVKYLKHIKLVDEPYHTWNESMNHSVARPDIGGKSRWYHFQFDLEGSDDPITGAAARAHPVHLRLDLGRTGGGDPVSRHRRARRSSADPRRALQGLGLYRSGREKTEPRDSQQQPAAVERRQRWHRRRRDVFLVGRRARGSPARGVAIGNSKLTPP
jgi:DMSO/TMAO reductase YedYZ molybdopterin-dependent catalytic subunit